MAVAFSQHAAGNFNTSQFGPPSNGTLDLTSVSNGDTILFVVITTSGLGLDSLSGCGATWSLLQSTGLPGYGSTDFYVGNVGTASGSIISFGNSSSNIIIDAAAMSFSGATSGVIASKVATGTNTTVVCNTNLPFESGQAVASFQIWVTGNGGSATPTGGYTDSPSAWTTADELAGSGNDNGIDSAYVITTGGGTYSRNATITNSGNTWVGFTALLSADSFPRRKSPYMRSRAVTRASVI